MGIGIPRTFFVETIYSLIKRLFQLKASSRQPLIRHEGIGTPRVMVQLLTRHGWSRLDLETRLREIVDPLTET